MVVYKCLKCNKNISEAMQGRRVRCPYCGSKLLFKPRTATTTVLAR